jgi:hypothetical protein
MQAHLIQHQRRCSSGGGTPYRKNYAGIGYTYDAGRDAFIPPQTLCILDAERGHLLWECTNVPYPNDGNYYLWNEESQSWNLITE